MSAFSTPEVARLEALRARIMSRANAAERASEHDIATVLRGIARSVDAALAEARAAPSPDGEIEALMRECYAAVLPEGGTLATWPDEDSVGAVIAWAASMKWGGGKEALEYAPTLNRALRALRDKLAPPELPDYDAMGWEELEALLPADWELRRDAHRDQCFIWSCAEGYGPKMRGHLGAVRAYCREHKLGAEGGAS